MIQTPSDLNAFYVKPDPWGYNQSKDDLKRRNELLSLLPARTWTRTLDIGCGDGFLTFSLPGDEIVGVDISGKAIQWAKNTCSSREDEDRFQFTESSIFELSKEDFGCFDLVVITGVLYSQYIGKAVSVVREIIDDLLLNDGVLASCHIDEWNPPKFAYTTLDITLYPYRGYMHRLEIYKK